MNNQCLNDLAVGGRGRVGRLTMDGSMRRRLLDLGFLADTPVECVGRSPGGDPRAYLIRGAVVAIRLADGAGILLKEEGE